MGYFTDRGIPILSFFMVLSSVIAAPGDTVLVGYLMRGEVEPPQCITPETKLLEVSSTAEEDLQGCALFLVKEYDETDKFLLIDLSIFPPTNQMTLVGSSWTYTDTGSGLWFNDPSNHFLTVTGITASNTGPLTDGDNPLQLKFPSGVSYPVYITFVQASCNVALCLSCADSDLYYCETCTDDATPNTDHSYCIACNTIPHCERCESDVNGDYAADTCTQCEDDYFVDGVSCIIIDCGDPVMIDDGSVSFTSTVIHTNAMYSCEEGYELIGDANVPCQSTAQWESTPSCLFVDCGYPSAPDNGSVTSTRTTFGATITYACTTGLEIEGGQSSATCEGNGEWSLSDPVCKVIDCGNVTAPNNGDVDFNSTLYLANALFTCSQDYFLIGNEIATCADSGQWEDIPSCQGTTTSTSGSNGGNETPIPQGQVSDNTKVTAGVIGGIVVGVVLVVAAALVVVIIYKVKKSKARPSVATEELTANGPTLTYRGQAIAPLKPKVRQDAWFNDESEEKVQPEKMREVFGPPQQPRPFGGGGGQTSSSSNNEAGFYGGSAMTDMDQYNLPNSPPLAYQSHNFTRPKSSLVKKR